jgi:hypothetical protein
MINYYKKAIEKNQVIDFFRGKGEYFELDIDRGIHNEAFTSLNVIGYATELGEEKLYNQLNIDLLKYFGIEDFSINDLSIVLNILWFYFVYRKEENVLKIDWDLPVKINELIVEKIKMFSSEKNELSNINRIVMNLEKRFAFKLEK